MFFISKYLDQKIILEYNFFYFMMLFLLFIFYGIKKLLHFKRRNHEFFVNSGGILPGFDWKKLNFLGFPLKPQKERFGQKKGSISRLILFRIKTS